MPIPCSVMSLCAVLCCSLLSVLTAATPVPRPSNAFNRPQGLSQPPSKGFRRPQGLSQRPSNALDRPERLGEARRQPRLPASPRSTASPSRRPDASSYPQPRFHAGPSSGSASGFPSNCTATYTYVPSALERRWISNVLVYSSQDKRWTAGCQAAKADQHHFEEWLEYIARLQTNRSLFQADRRALPDVLSHFAVTATGGADCPTGTQYLPIEPLAVALRHPRYPCWPWGRTPAGRTLSAHYYYYKNTSLLLHNYFFNTDWLVVVPPHTPVRRTYFFDLGSTYFDAGVAGAADSLRSLLHKYRTFAGVEFDEIFAWEAKPSQHTAYWKRVDLDMVHKLHFYNTPTSADLADAMSALRMILALLRPYRSFLPTGDRGG